MSFSVRDLPERQWFIRAANYAPAQRDRVLWIVLHSMEAPEKPGRARQVAEWFAGPKAPMASAHYCVDDREVVQCVEEKDVAWAAPGANRDGIQIELAGYAAQNQSQWADDYSAAMLSRAVDLCMDICLRWKIPAVLVGPSLLIERQPGITTHRFVSRAFGKSTHTDPGQHFPLEWFINRVAARLKAL